MSHMTYRDLLQGLQNLTAVQLDAPVTVFVRGTERFYPVEDEPGLCYAGYAPVPSAVAFEELDDKMDDGHPFLSI